MVADEIFKVAASLFAIHGYEGIGAREIAKRSGCSVPTIYYHFNSKENLYREVVKRKSAALADVISQAVTAGIDPKHRLQIFVGEFYRRIAEDRELHLLLLRDVVYSTSSRPRYMFGDCQERCTLVLQRIVTDLHGTEPDAALTFAVTSLILGYLCGQRLARQEEFPKLEEARLQEFVLRMLSSNS